jgi:U3 small nucleolar RNA-associated protein 15
LLIVYCRKMAADVQPLAQVKLPARPSSLTPEQTYWRTFKTPLNFESPTRHAITHISQPPSPQNGSSSTELFAVSTGARIQLFSHRTRKLVKTITRFDDTAYSGEIRYDGRVLVAGDETGAIQAFDVNSRAILKTWKEHKQPVHAVRWNPTDTTSLMSCGDDNTVRIWDLPSDTSTATFRGHQDYVRCGNFLPGQNSSILVSGSYDQTIRLWDPRAPLSPVMSFKHIGAVEDVLCMPSGSTILAAADNQIAVLDITAGRPLHMIKNHQKTVTSLSLASHESRVVSGGLDGHMKIFETTGWNVVAGSKYPSPILSLCVVSAGVNNDDKHVVVGMSSGQVSIKTRLSGEQKVKERQRQKEMEALLAGKIEEYDKKESKKRGRGWERRFRGREYAGEGADIIIQGEDGGKRKKLKQWEKDLHAGRYREALDEVLTTHDTVRIFSLLTALRYRSALRKSLENRTDGTLKPIMEWTLRNISVTPFVAICVEVSMLIMSLYSKHLAESAELAKQTEKLHSHVVQEVEKAKQAAATQGMLQLISADLVG